MTRVGSSSKQQIASASGTQSRTRWTSCPSVRHPKDRIFFALVRRSSVQIESAVNAPNAFLLTVEAPEKRDAPFPLCALFECALLPLRLPFLRVVRTSSHPSSASAFAATSSTVVLPASVTSATPAVFVFVSFSSFLTAVGTSSAAGVLEAGGFEGFREESFASVGRDVVETGGVVVVASLIAAEVASSCCCLASSCSSLSFAAFLKEDTMAFFSFFPLMPLSAAFRSESKVSWSDFNSCRCLCLRAWLM